MSHTTIVQLLPWYVNDTLGPDERRQVEAELASCTECAAELEELKTVRSAMLELEETAPSPSGFGLTRTLARIEEHERKTTAGPRRWLAWWSRLPLSGRALAAAPLALLLVLFAYALRPQERLPQDVALRGGLQRLAAPAAQTETQERRASDELDKSVAVNAVAAEGAKRVAVAGLALQRPQIIRTGSLSLLVPDVEKALNSVVSVAHAQFGEVMSLDDQTPSQPGALHTARVQVSVPHDRFDQAMDAFSKIGGVQARSVSAEDVSNQIVDAQARLRNLRRTETDMLKIMDRSGKVAEILSVENEISSVRQQIEQLDSQLKSMQQRVAYSAISVSLQNEASSPTVEPSDAARLGESWKAALRAVKGIALTLVAGLLWIVAFIPYLLAAGLISAVVITRYRGRR